MKMEQRNPLEVEKLIQSRYRSIKIKKNKSPTTQLRSVGRTEGGVANSSKKVPSI